MPRQRPADGTRRFAGICWEQFLEHYYRLVDAQWVERRPVDHQLWGAADSHRNDCRYRGLGKHRHRRHELGLH